MGFEPLRTDIQSSPQDGFPSNKKNALDPLCKRIFQDVMGRAALSHGICVNVAICQDGKTYPSNDTVVQTLKENGIEEKDLDFIFLPDVSDISSTTASCKKKHIYTYTYDENE